MKHLNLLNQLFGAVDSPNQTGETLTPSDEQRSRIPLLYPCYTFARVWKYVACMLMVLVLGIGQMWGDAVNNTISSFGASTGISNGGFRWSASGTSSNRLTVSSGGAVLLYMNSADSIITQLVINLGQSSSGTTLKSNLCEVKVSSDNSTYTDIDFAAGDNITNTSSSSGDVTFTNRDTINAKGYDKTGQITISFATGYRYVKLVRLSNNFHVSKIVYTADKKTSGGGGSGSSTTYDVTYNANSGGTGTTAAQEDNANGASVTTRANGFTPNSGKKFKWWNTVSGGTGTDYYPGEVLTIASADVELFAQWETVASNEEFWVGSPTTWTSSKFSVGDMDVKTNSTSKATFVTDLTSSDSKVNGSDKHAKVILVQDNNNYIQISFSDGSTINDLRLGITTTETSSKNAAVVYSTTEDFSSGEYETKTVSVPANNASAKSLTNFSPATSNKYKYVRIYRKISSAVYSFTGGSGNNLRIYAIKAQKGSSCTAPDNVSVTGTWDRFAGETITLTADVTGGSGSALTYQWQKYYNGQWNNIAGATSATYTKSNCTTDDSGTYQCIATYDGSCSTTSNSYTVYVYTLECYTGGTTVHHFTRTGDSQAGTLTMDLAANTAYQFKVHADTKYYGNNGTVNSDATNWVLCNNSTTECTTNLTVNSGLGGTFTFGIEYSTGGNSSVEGEPEISVTYPRKRIYLDPGVWKTPSDGEKFAYNYWRDGVSAQWTDFLTNSDCGMYADIPQWNGVKIIAVRLKNTTVTPGSWDNKWNQTDNITITSNDYVRITGWNQSDFTYNSNFSTPTYTISYAKGTPAASIDGSKADESKTCGVAFTLPNSAVFTRTGYTQTGWTTSDGGAQEYALGGTYTTNEDKTFYPVWTANQYTVTHTLEGVTKSSGATGANAATYGTNYTAEFAASSGYALPETITVTIGGSTKTAGTEYTWDQGTGTVVITGSYITGNIVITVNGESDSPCVIPSALTNEIARFQVPCDVDRSAAYNVTDEPYGSTNTYTTASFGANNNWYYDETTGLSYGKMTSSTGLTITIKLNTGNFQAGDVVYVYSNRNEASKGGVKVGSTNKVTIGVSSTAAGVEASGSYSLLSTDIEDDGSLKFYREGSNSFINRIIVTRPACTNVSITTQPTTPVAATVGSACSITGLVAAGTSPTYQWYTCNSDGSGAMAITSAGAMSFTGYTSATLGLTPTAAGATYYKCVVRGSCGDPVTSSVVTVNASAAAATPILSWALSTNVSTWTATPTNNDETNLTDVATSTEHAAIQSGATSGKTCKISLSSSATPDKYVTFTFKVACGKKLTPSSVWMEVANVGGNSDGKMTHKAELSDIYGHTISATVVPASDGVLNELNITNGGGTYFQGEVTLKVWAWNSTSGGDGSAFRMGPNVKIFGEVASQASPAATITWNTQPANGQVGDPDFAYDVTCSDGSAVTVTSANTTYATIVDGKLHYASAGTTHLVASATDACGNVLTPVNSNDFTVSAAAATYSVTHNLTNVTATSGATGAGAATEGVAYDAVFSANTGYVLPSTITVTIGGSPATVGTGYTWNASTGAFQVPAAQVTGAIVITIAGETASASECVTINTFSTSSPTTISQSPFVRSNTATGDDSNTYLMWGQHAGSDFKGENSGAYMLLYYNTAIRIFGGSTSSNLFSNVTSVSFKWRYSSASSSTTTTLKVYVGSTQVGTAAGYSITGTKNDAFATISITNINQLSGYIQIVQSGGSGTGAHLLLDDIEICTSSLDACTTPVIPTLSNKTVCEGGDADAAWDATITNSLATGESVAYSWTKKGNSTVLSSVATYRPTSVTEAMAGTYVVTATVSADDKASATATKEVTLTVNEATEVTAITADKATVYPTNSVTLTATANVSATWQWYTCTNAEGAGEEIISEATSASYTIASAGSAGTYYYKVKATGSCGIGSMVYTLTVSPAAGGDCETYYFFANADDATTNGVTQNADDFFSGAKAGTNNNSTNITVDGNKLTITKRNSAAAYSVVFTVPTGATASLYTNAKANSNTNKLTITRSSDSESMVVTDQTALANYTLSDIPEGTWTLTCGSGNNWYYGAIIVKVCSGVSCTDPEVTAKVNGASSATLCSGEASFTATDAHASATYQWQKYSGSTWTDISSARNATYTIASVTEGDEGKYRVIATHDCARTSNEVTLNVSATPVFGSLGGAREVETGGSLSITNVEASDATSYKWYRSSNNTYEAGTDEQVGTAKNLLLPVNDAAGTTFYLFCVATNTCGNVTSDAITVSVIAAAEKDCAVGTSSGDNFTTAKTSDVNGGSYLGQTELHMSSNNKYIYYTAADGYHFQTATVNCCAGDATALTKAAYGYSTDGGANWTDADLPGAMTNQYSDHVVNLPANVNAFRVGRVLNGKGVGSNTLYVHQVCFTYVADCNATTITVSNASPTYDLAAGGDFTEPTCTVKQGSTALSPQPALRYSSFNEAVATVDPSTGEVDFTGTAGSVVIMASYDGDEDYCASSATYTITVSCGSESAPKIVAGSGTNLSGCNASVSLAVKDQSGNNFASGSYQWYRDGEEIDGATSATYTAERTGTYTVSHTGECTQMSTNSAVVTSESFDPSVERLVPFQYYHADKTYTAQMKDRHLFAVTSGGDYEGKRYHMTATRNGDPLDISASTAFFVRTSIDNSVDTVMIDLNELKNKFSAGDEIVLTCAAIADCGTISAVTENIELHVIDDTPTLALICSGTNKSAGTRKTSELTVGGDFLTGYNKADLCVQTGNTSFDGSTEWGLYTKLKEHYLVTPVNGYAVFNKLNYEPFDICFLTDYPKSSKSPEAATVLDDMADLCDYRPLFSFKTHMVAKQPSKWAAKGFTTTAEVPKQSRLRLNITCYAHPMFEDIKGPDVARDYDDGSQIVYTMLSGAGYESSKGMQGFHLAAAENFVTIGLVHYNATATDDYEGSGNVKWTPGSGDEMLVAAAERQENIEARMIFFSLNCGAQSKLTAQGETVVLKCLEYLLNDATIEGNLSDCSLTFDNNAGDGNWNTPGNWGPDHVTVPGQYNAARIAAPATVNIPHAKALELRIMDGGSVTIPAGSGLEIKSTIRHLDGKTVSPTEVSDLHIGSDVDGNGTLIFNNNTGDTKAQVDMYSKGKTVDGTKHYQYIGTPFNEINALYNYYGARIYSWNGSGWTNVKNGGPMTAWTGYCISSSSTSDEYYQTSGTLTATTTKDITVPAGANMVIGNSWTAPIDINSFTNDDFENLNGNVYFFNTGVDVEGTGTVTANATGTTRWTAGTYVSVPIHAASYTGTDDHIPSLQGFFVTSSGSAGTLHLDYDKHVRGTTRDNILSGEMHAPARRAAVSSNEPAVLKIKVSGEKYDDKLLLLEREDFTTGKDFGWDGDKWDGNTSALYLYTSDSEGTENSVSAIPELEGTVIGFRAGEDDAYTLNFEYLNSDEPLYLYDVENNTYTRIMTGMTYRFFTTDNEKHARFIITRSNGQEVATGVEPVSGSLDRSKAKKLLIEDKMFIMVNGMLYDATGKVVK